MLLSPAGKVVPHVGDVIQSWIPEYNYEQASNVSPQLLPYLTRSLLKDSIIWL